MKKRLHSGLGYSRSSRPGGMSKQPPDARPAPRTHSAPNPTGDPPMTTPKSYTMSRDRTELSGG